MASLPPPPLPCINDVLPHHLLVQVFARLPYRTAFRSRSVCKLWLSCMHDDPWFVKRFIHHRIKNRSSNREDQQQVVGHVRCNLRVMLLVVTRPCGIIPHAPRFSLDFLPCLAGWKGTSHPSSRRLIVGSSNGLLLCTLNHEEYYICNPLTKQWLALPPPRRRHHYVQVGFICDPFYHVQYDGEDGSVTLNDRFGVKVVRLPFFLGNEEGSPIEMEVEIFSSQTGCWTTSTVMLPKRLRFDEYNPQIAIPHNGRLYWFVEPCDILIYDLSKNEFLLESHELPSFAMRSFFYWNRQLVEFKGFSLCQGSFWVGQTEKWLLRVFNLRNGEWFLTHDVHILHDMYCSSSLARQSVQRSYAGIEFRSMHPVDPNVAYLSVDGEILECDFRNRTIKVEAEIENYGQDSLQLVYWFNVLTFPLPLWPTPLPRLPAT
ncbi:unnamed protein product [Linum tenue]|uniref:F-box domain-containing protein n=1 Tax=Linum tenue TaxID=586396 RepID=A0AAV0IGR0_9ROSI|nr:unnamed protein product [Linum tenue]